MVGPVGLPLASGVTDKPVPPWRCCAAALRRVIGPPAPAGRPGWGAGGMYMPGMLGGGAEAFGPAFAATGPEPRRPSTTGPHCPSRRAAPSRPPPPVRLAGFQAAVSSMPFDEDESEPGPAPRSICRRPGPLPLRGRPCPGRPSPGRRLGSTRGRLDRQASRLIVREPANRTPGAGSRLAVPPCRKASPNLLFSVRRAKRIAPKT